MLEWFSGKSARKNGCIVSFDLNVRLALFEDHELLKKTILEFIPKADIIKLSIEELEFLASYESFKQRRKVLIITEVASLLLMLSV